MKKYFFLIWTFAIMIMCMLILYIGLYEKKNKESIYIKNEFRTLAKKYIDLEEIEVGKDGLKITTDDLIEKQYMEEFKYEDKVCRAVIEVDKFLIFNIYDVTYECR